MPQLGVRHQHTSVDDGAADAGAQGGHDDQAVVALGCPVVHLGQPGGVGVVDQRDGTVQVVLEELRRLKPRPGLVEVRDERHPPMHDRRGDGQPDAGPVGDLVLEILDDLRDHRGHVLGAGLRRGGDAQPGLGEVSQF